MVPHFGLLHRVPKERRTEQHDQLGLRTQRALSFPRRGP